MSEQDVTVESVAPRAARHGRNAGPTPKGERTRNQILDGAIGVVAARGVGGVTHRAVAREAGVSLSTTTYYFTSLDDLLTQAFLRLTDQMQSCPAASMDVFARTVEGASIGPDSSVEERHDLRDRLLGAVETYLAGVEAGAGNGGGETPEITRRRQQLLQAELRFFFEAAHINTLNDHLAERRDQMTEALLPLPQVLGSDDARLDAEMLYDLLLLAVYGRGCHLNGQGGKMIDPACLARFERVFGLMLRV